MSRNSHRFGLIAVVCLLVGATSCAQDVGDIDRTQPNKIEKSQFDGEWYIRHTIVDVPPTVANVFVGIGSPMEKIRWEVQEHYLVAYRSYEKTPGYDEKAGDIEEGEQQIAEGHSEGRNPNYTEEPVAAYPIVSHFDVQRTYNTSTGEPSNVVVEDMSDRPWHERKYMRVDWARNLVETSIPFAYGLNDSQSFYVQKNEGGPNSFYEEHRDLDPDNGGEELAYFDFTVKTSLPFCQPFFGQSGACATAGNEIEVRSSFQRLERPQRDYQPVFYDDNMMTKFGYFRTEREVYDRRRGFTDSGLIKLANRHDIWKNDFKTNDDGSWVRDSEGRRIPTPMAEREPTPVVYYLSAHYPEELKPSTRKMEEDYDETFERAMAAAKGLEPSELDAEGFLICDNPVPEEAPAACDPRPEEKRYDEDDTYVPYRARVGDLRRNFVYWVHEPQAAGPLGYGPSYADPETGEIISGTAYVYGASVDRYATRALDIVKLIRGDLEMQDALSGSDVREYIMGTLDEDIDPRGSADPEVREALENIPIGDLEKHMLDGDQRRRLEAIRSGEIDRLEAPANYRQNKIEELKEQGFDQLLLGDEDVRALSDGKLDPNEQVDSEKLRTLLEENNPFDVDKMLDRRHQHTIDLSRHNVYSGEATLDAVYGAAVRYATLDDYDEVYQRLRNDIYRGVMLHELGHTVGLRHNFQGSYDSVNFFDNYWEVREENFGTPETLQDTYETSRLTSNQRKSEMPRFMYSSIMDYHSRFNGDAAGLGKYDEAAILFAYTFGTYEDVEPTYDGALPVDEGFVEVFDGVPESVELTWTDGAFDPRQLLNSYDDRFSPSQHPLEDYHYSSVVQMLGGPESLTDRRLMRYGDLTAMRESDDEDRPVEVPYMMCSDEYAGFYVSCDRWDLGADPFEITRWAAKKYKAYYPFTHFRRDRLGFSSFNGAMSAQRTFSRFPNIYQRWLFSRARDPVLDQYFTFAAISGLNLLGDVMSTPSYGGYSKDEETGHLEIVSTGRECTEGDTVGRGNRARTIDHCISPGEGRKLYTSYDYGSGYYYYTRPTVAGHYWDQVMAMGALTQSVARVIGVNTSEQFRSYVLPYYLVFDDELTTLVNGLFREDYDSFAPVVSEEGELVQRPLAVLSANGQPLDPMSGQIVPPKGSTVTNASPVDTRISFNQRFRAFLLGVQFFNSNFSQHFIDQARIFKVGTGEEIGANPDEGYEQVRFTDPATGITYGAIDNANVEGTSLAVELVSEGAGLAEAYRNAGDSEQRQSLQRELDSLVEDIGIVSDAVELLGGALR